MNDVHLKNGGPIFIVFGYILPGINPGYILPGKNIYDIGKEIDALLLCTEHRPAVHTFYGNSSPAR